MSVRTELSFTVCWLALSACAAADPRLASDDTGHGSWDGGASDGRAASQPARGPDAGSVRQPTENRSDAATWAVVAGDSATAVGADGCGVLRAHLRDFKYDHPDFEHIVNGHVVKQLVQPRLGPDHKPVENPSVAASAGVQAFADWYNDGPENLSFALELTLMEETPGHFVYDSSAFFPLDDKGFGNQYRDHNYSFTTEIHTHFVYNGGEQFTFAGDDDVWVFINGQLAIDLGGVHARETETVALDARAAELGIQPGGDYTMDIFHAERHSSASNFRIETTIDCITPVLVI
jgi:fibro-slime domain-containing protein